MDGQSEFRTSTVLLTAAMMVCGVMGLFLVLPALRNQSSPPSAGPQQTTRLATPPLRDNLASEPARQQHDTGIYNSNDLRETVVNVGSRGSHSVNPVVVTRQVNNGGPGHSSGRLTEQPSVYVPVTVHPVTVNVESPGGSNPGFAAEMERLNQSLEALLSQQQLLSRQQAELQSARTVQNLEQPRMDENSVRSAIELQAQSEKLNAIHERLGALDQAIQSLQQNVPSVPAPVHSVDSMLTEHAPDKAAAPLQDAPLFEEIGQMSPILFLDDTAMPAGPVDMTEMHPASPVPAIPTMQSKPSDAPQSVFRDSPIEVAPVPPAESSAPARSLRTASRPAAAVSSAAAPASSDLSQWKHDPAMHGPIVNPLPPNLRPIDDSQRSRLSKTASYLKSRSWLPDLDMPQWIDRLPGSGFFDRDQSASHRESPRASQSGHHYAATASQPQGPATSNSPPGNSPPSNIPVFSQPTELSATSAAPPVPPVPGALSALEIRRASHQVPAAAQPQQHAQQNGPPVLRQPTTPSSQGVTPQSQPFRAHPPAHPRQSSQDRRPHKPTELPMPNHYTPSAKPGTPLNSILDSAPIHRISSALRFATRPQTVE